MVQAELPQELPQNGDSIPTQDLREVEEGVDSPRTLGDLRDAEVSIDSIDAIGAAKGYLSFMETGLHDDYHPGLDRFVAYLPAGLTAGAAALFEGVGFAGGSSTMELIGAGLGAAAAALGGTMAYFRRQGRKERQGRGQ